MVSFSLTLVFEVFYLMGTYYIKVHSVYAQKKEGSNGYKEQTLFILSYFIMLFLRETMCLVYLLEL